MAAIKRVVSIDMDNYPVSKLSRNAKKRMLLIGLRHTLNNIAYSNAMMIARREGGDAADYVEAERVRLWEKLQNE